MDQSGEKVISHESFFFIDARVHEKIEIVSFFKVVQEYERAVIFRLGRLMQGGAKGPGE